MALRLRTNGNDRFFASNGNDVFLGFAGKDAIDLSDFGVTEISELDIHSTSYGTSITIDGLTIEMKVSANALTDADFVFAAPPQTTAMTFDDISVQNSEEVFLPADYQGFAWTNFAILDADDYGAQYGTNG